MKNKADDALTFNQIPTKKSWKDEGLLLDKFRWEILLCFTTWRRQLFILFENDKEQQKQLPTT